MASQKTPAQEVLWIEESRNGSQKAFRLLYNFHVDALYRFMRQFSKDTFEVEDWVQRSFIKAFSAIHQFEGSSRFSSWLYRIALNEMQTDRRKKKLISFVESPEDNLPESSATPDIFEWDATMKVILDKLDETKKAVFLLYEIEGYSHMEIGQMMGFGESTSRTILSRAKQRLRQHWENERRAS